MSFSNFNRLPIEYITLDAATPLVIILLGFIQVFVCAILGWDNKIYAYFLGPKSSSSSSSIHIEQSNLQVKEIKKTEDNDKRVCLNKGDLEIVFRRLGIFSEKFSGVSGNSMYGFRVTESGNFICGAIPTKRFKPTIEMFGGADCSTYRFEKSPLFFSTTDKIGEIVDSETMFNLFDEDAVAAKEEEVKAAFDVYDENKDGFIDEFELQRVLCGLGFKEGLKIDNCRKMIILADVNGDGKLDFNEFVNFLQNSL